MDRRRFLGTTVVAGGVLLTASSVRATGNRMHDAINKSGRQRMLSQRLAKSYLQIGQGIDPVRSARIFVDSIALFEDQLKALQNFSPSVENRSTLAALDKTWLLYREALSTGQPNVRDGRQVMLLSDEVLALAHAATTQLEAMSGTTTGHLVNLSGRQRMLSQRMAKLYHAVNWGVASTDGLHQLVLARNAFLDAMQVLMSAPGNTPTIDAELALAQQQWFFFDQALKTGAVNAEMRARLANNVATTSERILETMDRITGLYEQT